MNKSQERMLAMLEDTASHYNVNNRSLNENGDCSYIPKDTTKSEGCAIGRLLPQSAKKFILKHGGNTMAVDTLFYNLPNRPRVFNGMSIHFLNNLQTLHDREIYWTEDGLSQDGENWVESIKSRFKLVQK